MNQGGIRRELPNPEDVQNVQNLIHETSPKLKDVERLTKYEKFRRPQQNANCLASAFADGTNTCSWQGLLFVKRLRTLPELDLTFQYVGVLKDSLQNDPTISYTNFVSLYTPAFLTIPDLRDGDKVNAMRKTLMLRQKDVLTSCRFVGSSRELALLTLDQCGA